MNLSPRHNWPRKNAKIAETEVFFAANSPVRKRLPSMNNPTRVLLPVLALLVALAVDASDALSVRDFGAEGDGRTDDTGAFQRALDAAGKAGGGTVHAPRGRAPNDGTSPLIWSKKKTFMTPDAP